jgi:hypothetical protein
LELLVVLGMHRSISNQGHHAPANWKVATAPDQASRDLRATLDKD